MIIEATLSKLLAGAASSMGSWIFNAAISHRRGKVAKQDIATANFLRTSNVTLKIDWTQIQHFSDDSLNLASLMQFINGPDCEALIRELLALRMVNHTNDRHAQLRSTFVSMLSTRIANDYAGDPQPPAKLIFDSLDDACARIATTIRTEYPDTFSRIQSNAQSSLIEATLDNILRHLKLISTSKSYTDQEHEHYIKEYRRQLSKAHGHIIPPDFDRRRKVPIGKLYVSPVFRSQNELFRGQQHYSLKDLRSELNRTVILGDPGGGKSTASSAIVHQEALKDEGPLPFLVVLREFAKVPEERGSIVAHIEGKLCSFYQLSSPPSGLVEHHLTTGDAIVVFDGLDELTDTSRRREITEIVELFCHQYPLAKVLVTSRSVGYEQAALDDTVFSTFYLSGYSDQDVSDYVQKWFKLDGMHPKECRAVVESFIRESSSVPDLRTNPLMLALMCIIYRGQNFIPRNRPEVYERCATMLFDKWDSHRQIHVPLEAGNMVDPILKHVAYWMLTNDQEQEGVRRSDLIKEISSYLSDRTFEDKEVASRAASEFVEFCRGRAWVFTDAGSTADGEDLYKFTHRTFMEYFSAYQLVRTSKSPEKLAHTLLPRIAKGEWDVVAQLSVQITNKGADRGADRVITTMLNERRKRSNSGRVAVISFICRCMSFLTPQPALVRRATAEVIKICLGGPTSSLRDSQDKMDLVGTLLLDAIEARTIIADEMRTLLSQLVKEGTIDQKIDVLTLVTMLGVLVQFKSRRSDSALSVKYWQDFSDNFISDQKEIMLSVCLHDKYLATRCVDNCDLTLDKYMIDGVFDSDHPIGRLFTDTKPRIFEIYYTSMASLCLTGNAADSDQWRKMSRWLADISKRVSLGIDPIVDSKNFGHTYFVDPGKSLAPLDARIIADADSTSWFSVAFILCTQFEQIGHFSGPNSLIEHASRRRLGSFGRLIRARAKCANNRRLQVQPSSWLPNTIALSADQATLLNSWASNTTNFVSKASG